VASFIGGRKDGGTEKGTIALMSPDAPPLLEVCNLSVDYIGPNNARLRAVEDVSFTLTEGEMLGLVGESGCGKTTLMLSLLRLLPAAGRIVDGQINFRGRDLLDLSESEMSQVRWRDIALIFQGAMNALNPVVSIGDQISEAIQCHTPINDHAKRSQAIGELLELVGISADRADQFPFQFSGGMRQRAMIAMALACHPQVLIADEPTTALDVMIQAQILELLDSLRRRLGQAIILVTHDLGVIAEVCDSVLVMYGGVTAEYASVDTIYNKATHPYTKDLIKAFPDLSNPGDKLASIPGYPPRLDQLPSGCRFAPRCRYAFERCHQERPPLYMLEKDHEASCFLVENEKIFRSHR
jgi:oligopeptide/dipeptide ABC transporter ATP-binding protein